MPVATSVDDDGSFVVFRFHEKVTTSDVLAASAETAKRATRDGEFVTLLLFEAGVDFSDIDADSINAIRSNREREFHDFGLKRRAGAAVVDGSLDARVVLKLWNAICDCDPDFDLSFQTFDQPSPALEWLDIPAARADPVISRTGYQPEP